MKPNLDCIPCFQKQALQAGRFISDDEKLHQKVLREVTKELFKSDWESTPPECSRAFINFRTFTVFYIQAINRMRYNQKS